MIRSVCERAEWCAEGRREERESELREGEVEKKRFELEELAISPTSELGLKY
jgi:hypothetical protein